MCHGKKPILKEQSDQGFVSVKVLQPSHPYGVILSAVNSPNHTFTALRLTSIVHILLPKTDKCSSWFKHILFHKVYMGTNIML